MSDFTIQRTKMVDGQIRTTDVTDIPLLDAMLSVPRELFVPEGRRGLAYIDEDLEIAPARNGSIPRYLMEPSPFAKLVQLADVGPSDRILEIGAGMGYGTAILSRIAGEVVGLEADGELAAAASAALGAIGADNASIVTGPLAAGHAQGGPYDMIVLEGCVEVVPDALFAQLKDGGRLAVVVGRGNAGVARLYVKSGETVSARRGFNAAVKPLPGFDRVPAFEF